MHSPVLIFEAHSLGLATIQAQKGNISLSPGVPELRPKPTWMLREERGFRLHAYWGLRKVLLLDLVWVWIWIVGWKSIWIVSVNMAVNMADGSIGSAHSLWLGRAPLLWGP